MANREQLDQVALESLRRQHEAIRLYRPMSGGQLSFHNSRASEELVRGGNRSGKTTSAMAEVASAALGVPLFGPDGVPLDYKYRADRSEPFIIWVIGKGQRHIGSPIHRLLFRRGAFRVIRDAKGHWRAWRPWEPEDKAREAETRPSPPLIPPRMIKNWAWEKKAGYIFESCFLNNNTEIHAFTSNADPKQGDPVDLIYIDEDIVYPHYYQEWQARISDKKGRIIWAAYPHSANRALRDLTNRAKEDAELEKPDVHEVVLTFSDNPFIDDEEKRKRIKGWSHDINVLRARDRGEYIFDATLIYPEFSPSVHGLNVTKEEAKTPIELEIAKNNGMIPSNWTRYFILDPGHTHPAGLFAAVPPPEVAPNGDIVLYAEHYPSRVDAYDFAEGMAHYFVGTNFEAFLIDSRAGRQTTMGQGMTVAQYYSRALEEYDIRCNRTGHLLAYASDNVSGGIAAVHDILALERTGHPRLHYLKDRMPNFETQMQEYKKKVVGDETLEVPEPHQRCDIADCLRYLAASNPRYVLPTSETVGSRAYQEFRKKKRLEEEREQFVGASLGPGRADTAGYSQEFAYGNFRE